ncbi:A-kinase anchor protein 9 isoform X3 [Arvicola amphibius]|uniref:A-kinase anchor protein 9 isoform X3 n=1 Tax=Arvicola amphibius TaxID=1047088 RepID=UPI0018E3CBE0|nr:A-kinase anchor protein 9 isoform X3 [Arvicola amphibius]
MEDEDEERLRKIAQGGALLAEYRERQARREGKKKKSVSKCKQDVHSLKINQQSNETFINSSQCVESAGNPDSTKMRAGQIETQNEVFVKDPHGERREPAPESCHMPPMPVLHTHIKSLDVIQPEGEISSLADNHSSLEEEEFDNCSQQGAQSSQTCLEMMENELAGKQLTIEELTGELEERRATCGPEVMQRLYEFEAAVKQRDGIITQLIANLQQAHKEKDETMREFSKLTEQSQKLQIQFQHLQAGETLRSNTHSSTATELLHVKQQVMAQQQQLEEQDRLLKDHQKKEEEFKIQITVLQEKIKEQDKKVESANNKIEEKQAIIEALNTRLVEEEKKTAMLTNQVTTADQLVGDLKGQLEEKDQETKSLKLELADSKQKVEQSSIEMKQYMETVEELQKKNHEVNFSETGIMQKMEKETEQKLAQLQAELDEEYGKQIVQMKQELIKQHMNQIEDLKSQHKGEMENTLKLRGNPAVNEEQVKLLSATMNELNMKVQHTLYQKEKFREELRVVKLEKCALQSQSNALLEELNALRDQIQRAKQTISEQENKLNEAGKSLSMVEDLKAEVTAAFESRKELELKHEAEITNYKIKLEMLEKEKNAVLDKMAESQEAELDRLRTQLLFSHEEELSKLKEDLEVEHRLNIERLKDNLGLQYKMQIADLQKEMSKKMEAMQCEKDSLLSKQSQLILEITDLKDLQESRNFQMNEIKKEIETLRQEEKEKGTLEQEIQELQLKTEQLEKILKAKEEDLQEKCVELEAENSILKDEKKVLEDMVKVYAPVEEEEKLIALTSDTYTSKDCSWQKEIDMLRKEKEDLKQQCIHLSKEIEMQRNTFSFAEKNFEVNYQELQEEYACLLRARDIQTKQALEYEHKVKALTEELQLQRGGPVMQEGRRSQLTDAATFIAEPLEVRELVEKDNIEFMEKLKVTEQEKLELSEKLSALSEQLRQTRDEVNCLSAEVKLLSQDKEELLLRCKELEVPTNPKGIEDAAVCPAQLSSWKTELTTGTDAHSGGCDSKISKDLPEESKIMVEDKIPSKGSGEDLILPTRTTEPSHGLVEPFEKEKLEQELCALKSTQDDLRLQMEAQRICLSLVYSAHAEQVREYMEKQRDEALCSLRDELVSAQEKKMDELQKMHQCQLQALQTQETGGHKEPLPALIGRLEKAVSEECCSISESLNSFLDEHYTPLKCEMNVEEKENSNVYNQNRNLKLQEYRYQVQDFQGHVQTLLSKLSDEYSKLVVLQTRLSKDEDDTQNVDERTPEETTLMRKAEDAAVDVNLCNERACMDSVVFRESDTQEAVLHGNCLNEQITSTTECSDGFEGRQERDITVMMEKQYQERLEEEIAKVIVSMSIAFAQQTELTRLSQGKAHSPQSEQACTPCSQEHPFSDITSQAQLDPQSPLGIDRNLKGQFKPLSNELEEHKKEVPLCNHENLEDESLKLKDQGLTISQNLLSKDETITVLQSIHDEVSDMETSRQLEDMRQELVRQYEEHQQATELMRQAHVQQMERQREDQEQLREEIKRLNEQLAEHRNAEKENINCSDGFEGRQERDISMVMEKQYQERLEEEIGKVIVSMSIAFAQQTELTRLSQGKAHSPQSEQACTPCSQEHPFSDITSQAQLDPQSPLGIDRNLKGQFKPLSNELEEHKKEVPLCNHENLEDESLKLKDQGLTISQNLLSKDETITVLQSIHDEVSDMETSRQLEDMRQELVRQYEEHQQATELMRQAHVQQMERQREDQEQLREEIKRLNEQLAESSSLYIDSVVSERERVLLEELEALKQLSLAGREQLCCELRDSSTQTQLTQDEDDTQNVDEGTPEETTLMRKAEDAAVDVNLCNERHALQKANSRLLKILLEVANTTAAVEETIGCHVFKILDRSSKAQPAPSLPWRTEADVCAKPGFHEEYGRVTDESLPSYPGNAISRNDGKWSNVTDKESDLSQQLGTSSFAGPEGDPENVQFMLNVSSRLQAAVEKLLEAISETSSQLEHAKVTQTQLVCETVRQKQEAAESLRCIEELQERLQDESSAREQLAVELNRAENIIDGYSDEKLAFEREIQEKSYVIDHLEQQLLCANQRLQELEAEQQQVQEERELLSRQKAAMREMAGPVEQRFLQETEKLMKEKLQVQCQAEKVHSELQNQVKILEIDVEEKISKLIEMEQEKNAEVTDLRQQNQALEKQLENLRKFVDEQTVDREHERDIFQMEIQKLEQQIKVVPRPQPPSEQQAREIEKLTGHLREKADQCSELLLHKEQLQREVQDRDAAIEELQCRRRELEHALLASAESTAEKNNQKQSGGVETDPGLSLEVQLQAERDAIDRKEKEISNLEEQLEQFREELENKNDEVQELHMQLEIQRKESTTRLQELQQENKLYQDEMKKLEFIVKESDPTPLPDQPTLFGKFAQIIQEKDAKIDQLNEQLAKVHHQLKLATDKEASSTPALTYSNARQTREISSSDSDSELDQAFDIASEGQEECESSPVVPKVVKGLLRAVHTEGIQMLSIADLPDDDGQDPSKGTEYQMSVECVQSREEAADTASQELLDCSMQQSGKLETKEQPCSMKDKMAKLQEQLSSEKTVVSKLKYALSQTQLELEATLKVQHKHIKDLEAFRLKVQDKVDDGHLLTDTLENEQMKSQELQCALATEKAKSGHSEEQDEELKDLRFILEDQKQRNIHLDILLGQQKQLLNDLQEKMESQKILHNAQLSEEQGRNIMLQVLLESEKVRIRELTESLDKERELHAQLKNRGDDLQPQPVVPPAELLQYLQEQVEEKQKRIIELVNESQKYKLDSLETKYQMEKDRQIHQKTLQLEKEANNLGQRKMEELQGKVEELQLQLEEKRHQVHKLDLEGKRLQAIMQEFQNQELGREEKRRSKRLVYQNINEEATWNVTDDRTRNWVLQQKMEETKNTSYAKVIETNGGAIVSYNDVDVIRQKLQHLATKLQLHIAQKACNRQEFEVSDEDVLNWVRERIDRLILRVQRLTSCPHNEHSLVSSSTSCTETILRQNSELTGHVNQLTEEKNNLRNIIMQLEEQIKFYQQTSADRNCFSRFSFDGSASIKDIIASEKEVWSNEKLTLQKSLQRAEAKVCRLKDELKNDTLHQNRSPENAVLKRIYGKYLRAESFRKALVFQKKYLLLLLGRFQECEEATVGLLFHMTGFPGFSNPETGTSRPKGLAIFRRAIRVSIAITRMKYLVRRWHRVKASGPNNVNRDGFGVGPGVERTDPLYHSTSGLELYPDPRQMTHYSSRSDLDFPRSPLPFNRYPGTLADFHPVLTNPQLQQYNPGRTLTDYVTQIDALQRRLGTTLQSGSPASQYHTGMRR